MAHSTTPFDRRPIYAGATLRLCDPETHQPLSKPIEAVALDVGAGGMRFEVHNLPRELSQSMGPDLAIAVTFNSKNLNLSGDLHMNVAWFHPQLERESSARALLGAYFTKISDADRAQLLRLAESPSWRRIGMTASFFVALSIVGGSLLMGWIYAAALRAQVTELDHRLDQLVILLEAERKAHERQTSKRESDRVDVVEPSAPAVVGASVDAGTEGLPRMASVVRVDRGKSRGSAVKSKAIEFEVRRKPDGIGLRSLELLQGDFIGTLTSELADDTGVAVFLNYSCASSDPDGGSDSCVCEAPQIAVPKRGKIEFACIPHSAKALGDDRPVLITIQ